MEFLTFKRFFFNYCIRQIPHQPALIVRFVFRTNRTNRWTALYCIEKYFYI